MARFVRAMRQTAGCPTPGGPRYRQPLLLFMWNHRKL